jgi:hypothetical protein
MRQLTATIDHGPVHTLAVGDFDFAEWLDADWSRIWDSTRSRSSAWADATTPRTERPVRFVAEEAWIGATTFRTLIVS